MPLLMVVTDPVWYQVQDCVDKKVLARILRPEIIVTPTY